MARTKKRCYCEKCGQTMNAIEFYVSNNLKKYPNEGRLPQCKKCLTMHVDNWDPNSFLWILQELDVPWIPAEWDKLMENYAKDRTKVNGMTILGRYAGKMRLNQFKKYRWKDNNYLKELADKELKETMQENGYDEEAIAAAIKKQDYSVPNHELEIPVYQEEEKEEKNEEEEEEKEIKEEKKEEKEEIEDYFEQEDITETLDLTEEDRIYLRLKWGKYRPEEWVRLEQLYSDMMESYDIQQAGHIDTLKLICKTSLKANQLLDIGDVDGSQKMVKMYEALMKSGKFTAAQNKAEHGEFVDSLSELVSICEKEGFIPRFYTDGPMDKVDETLADLKSYTHSLVVDEMNLGNLIEGAVKEMVRIENQEEDDDIDENEELTIDNIEQLKDEDFEEYNNFIEEETIEDDEHLLELLKESEKI